MTAFDVRVLRGPPAVLHAADLPVESRPCLWVMEPTSAALVLGSTQDRGDVDGATTTRDGIAIARRRTGGGAVLVEPGGIWWGDLVIGRGDARWRDDVVASAAWVGDLFATVLHALGIGDTAVHAGRWVATPEARRACFAGIGPGEVQVDGRKVVGISQRRTNAGARFQCAVLLRPDVARTATYLLPSGGSRRALAAHLGASCAAVNVTSATFTAEIARALGC